MPRLRSGAVTAARPVGTSRRALLPAGVDRRVSAVAAEPTMRTAPREPIRTRRSSSVYAQPVASTEPRDELPAVPPRQDPRRDSVAPVSRRESLLSARGTEERPREPTRQRSHSRSPVTAAKRDRAEGALTRLAASRRCWLDILPDELLGLNILQSFDTRHLLYLRLTSRKFQACVQYVPSFGLRAVRRRMENARVRSLLGYFPIAQCIMLPSCLAHSTHSLAPILQRDASRVQSLVLSGNYLGVEHAKQLGSWFSSSQELNLRLLDLSDNALCSARGTSTTLDDTGLKALLAPFAPVRSSRHSSASRSPEGEASGSRLPSSISLGELDLSRNQMCHSGASVLASVLKSSKSLACSGSGLKSLRLANCLLGTMGAEVLVPALNKCLALTRLDLTSNFLYDTGAVAVSSWLGSHAPRLQYLSLAFNGIEDKGADSLAAAIESKQMAAELAELKSISTGRECVRLIRVDLGGNTWSHSRVNAFERLAHAHCLDIHLKASPPFTLASAK